MNREDFDAWDQRIRDRAQLLWEEHGKPEGSRDRFLEDARELVAIEENPTSGQIDPYDAAEPVIEEAALMRNLGEFPTLTDQGEEQTYPSSDGEIRLSDGDPSDNGGVLPAADLPEETLVDLALSEADITSDTFGTDQAPASTNADINDDGFPDEPDLDDDDEDDEEDDDEDEDDEEDDDDDDGDDTDPDGDRVEDDRGSRTGSMIRGNPAV